MTRIHELKTYPEHFAAVKSGLKNTELRINDRDFCVGDTLLLKEYFNDAFTGHKLVIQIKHITDVSFIVPDYVMLHLENAYINKSIRLCERLVNPDDLGYAVEPEVRREAYKVLQHAGLRPKETPCK